MSVSHPPATAREADVATTVDALVSALRAAGSEENRAGMARYGIRVDRAVGASIPIVRSLARHHRKDHPLALALWATTVHEARILAGLVDDPNAVTIEQITAWTADFDSWDLCDQVTGTLFVKAPSALTLPAMLAADEREFVRRAAFTLIAALATHAKTTSDSELLPLLALVGAHATDPRNFVKKAVNWALRGLGKRSVALHVSALALARDLEASPNRTAHWIGRDAVKELTSEAVLARLEARLSKKRDRLPDRVDTTTHHQHGDDE